MSAPGVWTRFKRNTSRRMASGMLVLVPVGVTLLIPAEMVLVTDLAIEEGFKTLISGGIVAPEDLLKPGNNRGRNDAASDA